MLTVYVSQRAGSFSCFWVKHARWVGHAMATALLCCCSNRVWHEIEHVSSAKTCKLELPLHRHHLCQARLLPYMDGLAVHGCDYGGVAGWQLT